MVASYEFYRDVYFGEILTAEDFPKYATRADVYLNELTYGRYMDSSLPEATITAVKMSECAIADLCFTTEAESAVSSAISKETVGDHSVTYRTGSDAAKTLSARIKETAERYLFPTGLLYRGARLEFRV